MQELRNTLRPEFLNRIDEVVIFSPLGRDEIARIVDIQLGYLRRRLAARRIELEVTDAAAASSAAKATIRRSARGRSSGPSSGWFRIRCRSSCSSAS